MMIENHFSANEEIILFSAVFFEYVENGLKNIIRWF